MHFLDGLHDGFFNWNAYYFGKYTFVEKVFNYKPIELKFYKSEIKI